MFKTFLPCRLFNNAILVCFDDARCPWRPWDDMFHFCYRNVWKDRLCSSAADQGREGFILMNIWWVLCSDNLTLKLTLWAHLITRSVPRSSRRNSSWLTEWRAAVAELSVAAVLCDGGFEIVIKEKWSALVVKAMMRCWLRSTETSRDPLGDPFTAWGKTPQTSCGFCVFYWSFKTEQFVLGKILYVPELSSP